MNSYLNILIKSRLAVIAIVVAATAWLSLFLGNLQFDSSCDGSVPKNDAHVAFFEQTKRTFGNDQVAVLVVTREHPLGVFCPETLARIMRLTDSLEATPGVTDVVSLANATTLSGDATSLANEPIIPEIPRSKEEAQAIRARVLDNPLYRKTLVSDDGKAAAINIFLSDLPDSALLATDVDNRINRIALANTGPENIYYAGLIHTRMEINKAIYRDIRTLGPAALIIILVILFVVYRRGRAVLIPAATILVTCLCTFGIIALLGMTISLTAAIIPPLLIAITSTMGIHIVNAYMAEKSGGGNASQTLHTAFAELTSPLFIAGITTVMGFASLLVSPIPNIQKVGVISCLGILLSLAVSFSFTPALIALIGLPAAKSESGRGGNWAQWTADRLGQFSTKYSKHVLVAVVLVMILSAIGISRITVNTDFLSYFRDDSDVRIAADVISDHLAGVSTFYLVLDSDSANIMTRPEVLQGVDSLQKFMEALPEIDRATSMVDIVKLFHQAKSGGIADSFIVARSADELEQEIFVTIGLEDPAVRSHYVVEDFSEMSIFVRSQAVSTEQLSATIAAIEKKAAEILPPSITATTTGTVVILAKTISSIISGQRDSLILAIALIFGTVTLLFRSVRIGLLSMVPNLLPIAVTFGIMGWLRLPLNVGTSLVGSIALGIAVDDTIHLLMQFRRYKRSGRSTADSIQCMTRRVGKPVVCTTVTLAAGFGVVGFSGFGMLSTVGFLAAFTIVTCLLADLLVTPALLTAFLSTSRINETATHKLQTKRRYTMYRTIKNSLMLLLAATLSFGSILAETGADPSSDTPDSVTSGTDATIDDSEFDWFGLDQTYPRFEIGGFAKTANAVRFSEGDKRFPAVILLNDDVYYGAYDPTSVLAMQQNTLHIQANGYHSPQLKSYAALDLQAGAAPERPFGNQIYPEIDELYLSYTKDRTKLTFGKEKVVWGVMDVVSPFNIINSRDLMSPFVNSGLEDARGQWQIHLSYDGVYSDKGFRFEALFSPVWNPSRVPTIKLKSDGNEVVTESDYWVPPIFSSVPQLLAIADDDGAIVIRNKFDGIEKPTADLSTAGLGLRLTTAVNQFSLGAYYITTMDPTPMPKIYTTVDTIRINGYYPMVGVLNEISQEYHRIHVAGLSGEKIWGKFRVKGELAFSYGHRYFPNITTEKGLIRIYEDAMRNPNVRRAGKVGGEPYSATHLLFGGEYTIPNVDILTSAQIAVITRHGYDDMYFGEESSLDLTFYAQKSFTGSKVNSSLSLAGLVETESKSVYITPRITLIPVRNENIELSGGLNLFVSSKVPDDSARMTSYRSILASYQDYSNIFVTAKMLFNVM